MYAVVYMIPSYEDIISEMLNSSVQIKVRQNKEMVFD